MRDYISDKKINNGIWFPAKIIIAVLFAMLLTGCAKKEHSYNTDNWSGMEKTGELSLSYATEFKVDLYGNDIRLISIGEDSRFLLVPETMEVPDGVPSDIKVIHGTVENVYLASTSAMDYVRTLGEIDRIKLVGIKSDEWHIKEAKTAMEEGSMQYVGKYNSPDYEMILQSGCDLVVENTMIDHKPEVKEKLESFDIPVIVERSSYESNPLGRMEWIKLYGVLFGKEEEAEKLFNDIMSVMDGVMNQDNTGKTVAFFYVTGNNAINVRKANDYIAKLIEMSGGEYIFKDLKEDEENALATVNMQQEAFYAGAKDADILIYNSTIVGQLNSKQELLDLCPILADFKAVQSGEVYCTGKNFFQESLSMSEFARELNMILNGNYEDNMQYIYKLK